MKAGFLRLILVNGFLGLFLYLILLMISTSPSSPPSSSLPQESNCSFFLGLKPPLANHPSSSLVLEKDFHSFTSSLPHSLKKEKWGFVLPLFLTKEEKWIVSYKSFLFTPQGREEISYLSLKDIQSSFQNPLLLEKVLALFPKKILFLRISTKDPEKIFKNLKFLYNRKNIFIASQNEDLIQALVQDSAPFSIVHSFRSLVRLQFMNLLGLDKAFFLPAQGIEIPSAFSPSSSLIKKLKKRGKLLYLEQEAPFSTIPSDLLLNLSGILTFDWKKGMQFIKNKNPCIKKF